MSRTGMLILLMSLGLLGAGLLPNWSGFGNIEHYAPVHTLLEIMSVVVSVLVFTAGWNAFGRSLPRGAVILAAAFLGVALLDISHALSFPGMPEFVTHSSPQKAINFWLAARLMAALALLTVAVLPPTEMASHTSRNTWLTAVLGVVTGVHLLIFFRSQWLPATYEPGLGLTAFKIAAEYLIIAVLVLTAVLLWRGMARPQTFHAPALFAAACIMALSEGFFTLYTHANDFYNLVGHLYKVVAYAFLYRAVFVQVIEAPYRELADMSDRLNATLEAVPDVMLEMDLNGRYHAVHTSRQEILLRPAGDLLGKTVYEVLPQPQADAVVAALNEALDKGTSTGVQLELAMAGRHRWFELSVSRKGQAAGASTRFIVLSRDITERKQVEAAVLQQEAAQQASRAKNEFLSRVSHELRTPLNAVIGFAQLLLHGGGPSSASLSASQKLHAEYILQAGQHLLEMINDILDLTRIESGAADLNKEPVPVALLMREVLPMVLRQAEVAAVTLDAAAMDRSTWRVMGDKRRLKQVLLNVLSNAIKFNRRGGQVVVRCEPSMTQAGMLSLIVSDTGRGLTPAQLQSLFEPFNRLGADQEGIEGTGLGLFITRRLVEAMNGEIHFDSTPGVGTIVTLMLPLASADQEGAAPLAPPGAPGHPAVLLHEPSASVVCVEDNPLSSALLEAIFAMRPGLRLHMAANAEEALALIRQSRPDVVLIDMNLPDMHGTALLQQIRQLPHCADLVCIAMSADVFGDPGDAARRQGFADFWFKPLDVDGVLKQLDAVVASVDHRQARLWSAFERVAPATVA